MNLLDRANLADNTPEFQRRTRVALAAQCTEILRTTLASAATDAAKKALRIRQRWAERVLANPEPIAAKVALMIAGAATDAALDDGIDDAELKTFVAIAIDALAAVELHVVTETLPA